MNHSFKQSLGVTAIAFANGLLFYPHLKRYYNQFYSISLPKEDPTHFVSFLTFIYILNYNYQLLTLYLYRFIWTLTWMEKILADLTLNCLAIVHPSLLTTLSALSLVTIVDITDIKARISIEFMSKDFFREETCLMIMDKALQLFMIKGRCRLRKIVSNLMSLICWQWLLIKMVIPVVSSLLLYKKCLI